MKGSLSEREQWWQRELASFQERLGYFFSKKEILQEALTHASYAHEKGLHFHNERLEFLGDAVLELIVSTNLFNGYPDVDEGTLTRYRSNLVCKNALSVWGKSIGLPQIIRLGKGLEQQGASASIIADTSEAVLGAVFSDGGFAAAQNVVRRYLFFQSNINAYDKNSDPKSLIQEETQKRGLGQPCYVVISTEGPPHMPIFTVQLKIDGQLYGSGQGHSIKVAETLAAQRALEQVGLGCKK